MFDPIFPSPDPDRRHIAIFNRFGTVVKTPRVLIPPIADKHRLFHICMRRKEKLSLPLFPCTHYSPFLGVTFIHVPSVNGPKREGGGRETVG